MTLPETDITNIYKIFIAICNICHDEWIGLSLGDNLMPLSNHIELCELEVKTFIPHDILSIQY